MFLIPAFRQFQLVFFYNGWNWQKNEKMLDKLVEVVKILENQNFVEPYFIWRAAALFSFPRPNKVCEPPRTKIDAIFKE